MVKIAYIEASGETRTVEARVGQTLMDAAVKNSIPGILADCGGACACATCLVYVDEAWRETTGEANDLERSMLEFSEDEDPRGRLSCQIKVTDDLDGLVLHMPLEQP